MFIAITPMLPQPILSPNCLAASFALFHFVSLDAFDGAGNVIEIVILQVANARVDNAAKTASRASIVTVIHQYCIFIFLTASASDGGIYM